MRSESLAVAFAVQLLCTAHPQAQGLVCPDDVCCACYCIAEGRPAYVNNLVKNANNRFPTSTIGVYLDTCYKPSWWDDPISFFNAAVYEWSANTQITLVAGNNQINVGFVEEDWSQWGDANVMAVCQQGPGVGLSAIWINCENFGDSDWNDEGDPCGRSDYFGVLVHELGHAVGLDHEFEGREGCTVMVEGAETGGACDLRTVKVIDQQAIKCLYGICEGSGGGGLAASLSECTSDVVCPIPASEVGYFKIANGVASWDVWHEYNTEQYLLEGCDTPNGPGVPLVTEATGLGHHQIAVPAGFPIVRLAEIETSSNKIILDVASYYNNRDASSPVVSGEIARSVDRTREAREKWAGPKSQANNAPTTGDPTYVIFTVPAYVASVQDMVESYWEAKGQVVEIVSVAPPAYPTDPALRQQQIKQDIAAYAAAYGTKYFHLIGDSETDLLASPLWDSSPYWQSKRDAYLKTGMLSATANPGGNEIPAFANPKVDLRPEVSYGSYVLTVTDQEYADTNDDGIPDVVVSRWPVESLSDLTAIATKMQQHNDVGVYSPYTSSFFVTDVDMIEPGSGAATRAMADWIERALLNSAPGQNVTRLYATDYLDYTQRDVAATAKPQRFLPRGASPVWHEFEPVQPGEFLLEKRRMERKRASKRDYGAPCGCSELPDHGLGAYLRALGTARLRGLSLWGPQGSRGVDRFRRGYGTGC